MYQICYRLDILIYLSLNLASGNNLKYVSSSFFFFPVCILFCFIVVIIINRTKIQQEAPSAPASPWTEKVAQPSPGKFPRWTGRLLLQQPARQILNYGRRAKRWSTVVVLFYLFVSSIVSLMECWKHAALVF